MRSPYVLPVSSIPASRGKEGAGIGILTFVYSPADVSVNIPFQKNWESCLMENNIIWKRSGKG